MNKDKLAKREGKIELRCSQDKEERGLKKAWEKNDPLRCSRLEQRYLPMLSKKGVIGGRKVLENRKGVLLRAFYSKSNQKQIKELFRTKVVRKVGASPG